MWCGGWWFVQGRCGIPDKTQPAAALVYVTAMARGSLFAETRTVETPHRHSQHEPKAQTTSTRDATAETAQAENQAPAPGWTGSFCCRNEPAHTPATPTACCCTWLQHNSTQHSCRMQSSRPQTRPGTGNACWCPCSSCRSLTNTRLGCCCCHWHRHPRTHCCCSCLQLWQILVVAVLCACCVTGPWRVATKVFKVHTAQGPCSASSTHHLHARGKQEAPYYSWVLVT